MDSKRLSGSYNYSSGSQSTFHDNWVVFVSILKYSCLSLTCQYQRICTFLLCEIQWTLDSVDDTSYIVHFLIFHWNVI